MSTKQRDEYAHGYGVGTDTFLRLRNAERYAAFFLPHLQGGMSLIDIGCGQGNITVGLAQAVAPGECVGVDIEESQIEIARQNGERAGLNNVRFEAGTAYELQFEDESFDAVFIHTLLEHLSRPEDAIVEAKRVLKPGGVIGVKHGDTGGCGLVYPLTPAMAFWTWRCVKPLEPNSGPDIQLGRKQERLLRSSGFRDLETTVVSNPRRHHIEAFADVLEARDPLFVNRGIFSQEEYDDDAFMSQIIEGMREWAKDPDAILIRSMSWETVAWK